MHPWSCTHVFLREANHLGYQQLWPLSRVARRAYQQDRFFYPQHQTKIKIMAATMWREAYKRLHVVPSEHTQFPCRRKTLVQLVHDHVHTDLLWGTDLLLEIHLHPFPYIGCAREKWTDNFLSSLDCASTGDSVCSGTSSAPMERMQASPISAETKPSDGCCSCDHKLLTVSIATATSWRNKMQLTPVFTSPSTEVMS